MVEHLGLSKLKDKKLLFATWSSDIKEYYQYRDWRPLLSKVFGTFISFSPRTNYLRYGREKMNKMFLDIVEKEKPDYILLSLSYDEFPPETFNKIRQISPKTKTINFFGDDDWRYDDWTRYYGHYIDYTLTAKKDLSLYKKEGIQKVSFFWGVNTSVLKKLDVKKEYDVTFIGSPVADRYDYIKFLKENKVNIKLFGPGWSDYADLKDIYQGFLSSEDFVKVINQSKINLSFSKTFYNEGKKGQFKGRLFEVGACKAFQLVESSPTLFGVFNKNPAINFDDKKELLEKINYYLKNEEKREQGAEKVYDYVIKNYSWEAMFGELFARIQKEEKSFKHSSLPTVKGKIIYLKESFLNKNKEDFFKDLENYEYIGFEDNSIEIDPNRANIQAYSLAVSKKDISISDYYVHSNNMGDYLLFSSKKAFNTLPLESFRKLLIPGQILVRKKYLLDNYESFKNLFSEDKLSQNIISKDNSVFISLPLIRTKKLKEIGYEEMLKAFQMKFRDRLYSEIYQKKIFLTPFVYSLIFGSLLKGQLFISKYLYKFAFNKDTWLKIKGKL
ncbi:MAG: glycosyltransferase [Nanoarchaeota archaeon]|nr:glycosyltransferase [Nanoarchaeota archaeon]